MSLFQTVLADVFDRGAERRIADPADEAAMIAAAKTGDESATVALVYAYAPALRNAVSTYAGRSSTTGEQRGTLAVEDAQAEAIAAFIGVIASHDADRSPRLAGRVVDGVCLALSEASGAMLPVPVPDRTLRRFYGILRRAEGDLDAAAALAPSFDMSEDTFRAVAEALRSWESLDVEPSEGGPTVTDHARPLWDDEDAFADAEDRILCEVAFGAVDDLEEDVTRAAYGFSSYRPKSDAEIAGDLAMSRPTVQRTRSRALGKMREALAVDVDA